MNVQGSSMYTDSLSTGSSLNDVDEDKIKELVRTIEPVPPEVSICFPIK